MTDGSGSRLCKNTKSFSQIPILANFGQQTCSESNYMRFFCLIFRSEFGEPFTQDETYYIVTCEQDAQIFLGLREDTDVEALKKF